MPFDIVFSPKNCSGCWRCMLACSFSKQGCFNPLAANLFVEVTSQGAKISFSQNCDHCGLCADACFYGALEKVRIKEAL
ncbi:MAG: 4Fe-4S binding protein [Desulfatibacillaceae bacterium]|nr:4Fe-4S binding protein [Desulfatibacillaceae bacterium]